MENELMNNDIVTTEAIGEVVVQEATPSGSGLKKVAVVGGIMTLGALAWEFGVKPAARKLRRTVRNARDRRKAKQNAVSDEMIIGGEVDEEYPI